METIFSLLGNIATTIIALVSGVVVIYQATKNGVNLVRWCKKNIFDKFVMIDNHEKRITKLEGKEHEEMAIQLES